MTMSIHDKVAEIRDWRKGKAAVSLPVFEAGEIKLKSELVDLKANKSAAIDTEMEKLSTAVAAPGFKLALVQKIGPKAKPVYCMEEAGFEPAIRFG